MRTHYCRNCGTPVRGDFCHVCGQKDDDYRRPILSLTNEFFGDVFQWDSRILRSFIPFLFLPGNLTRAYVRGRRQQYVSPLRLYFVLTFLFFSLLVVSGRALIGVENRSLLEDFPELAEQLEGVDEAQLRYDRGAEPAFFVNPAHLARADHIDIEGLADQFERPLPRPVLAVMEGYNSAVDDPRILNTIVKNAVPWLMVILVPFFAMVLGALYVRRRTYLIDHVVFALHYHSFMFALLLIGLGLATLFDVPISLFGLGGVFLAILVIYLYVAMLRVYRGGIIKTAFKLVLLAVVYANVFLSGIIAVTIIGLAGV